MKLYLTPRTISELYAEFDPDIRKDIMSKEFVTYTQTVYNGILTKEYRPDNLLTKGWLIEFDDLSDLNNFCRRFEI